MTAFDLKAYLKERKALADGALERAMAGIAGPKRLLDAMAYSLLSDGKRVRPILTLASADVLGLPHGDVLPIAVSLEMIHVFSLIHDDLPAMDDDDLRRGRPTNHKVYGEAAAILAGDALLSEAFVPLTALPARYGMDNILSVISLVARATGPAGMIGGQIVDLDAEGKNVPLEELRALHRMKTGALISAAVISPAVLAGTDEKTRRALERYADAIGLAFQIADDILDVEGGAEIGKDVGSDAERGKSTYPALLGLAGAKKELRESLDRALGALEAFDGRAEALRELARYIVERKK